MFKKALQVLNTSRELWLLYSHEKINLVALKQAIDTAIKAKKKKVIPYALVYTNIRNGKGF